MSMLLKHFNAVHSRMEEWMASIKVQHGLLTSLVDKPIQTQELQNRFCALLRAEHAKNQEKLHLVDELGQAVADEVGTYRAIYKQHLSRVKAEAVSPESVAWAMPAPPEHQRPERFVPRRQTAVRPSRDQTGRHIPFWSLEPPRRFSGRRA